MKMLLQGRTPRYATRGVTLIELVVALVILSILAAIGVPSMIGLIRDARLSSYTDLLVNGLNLARIEAIKQRRYIMVCTVTDPNTSTVCMNSNDWSRGFIVVDELTGNVIRREPFQGGMSVQIVGRPINFDWNGNITATAAQPITLCISGRQQQQVDVQMSGHVSKKVNSAVLCS